MLRRNDVRFGGRPAGQRSLLGACLQRRRRTEWRRAATSDREEAAGDGDGGGGLLAEVQDRGTLNCGVNETVPGFGLVDEQGDYAGFDVEYCRVIAAAVLGDADAVEYTPLRPSSASRRWPRRDRRAEPQHDVDGEPRRRRGRRFLHTTFYDGQGMMVRADAGFASIEDMGGTTICVPQGTTTELNLPTRFASACLRLPAADLPRRRRHPGGVLGRSVRRLDLRPAPAGRRALLLPAGEGGPESLTIFDEAFSKEPLGPVVRDGDDEWADAVNWAVIATVQAEEFGITSENVADETSCGEPRRPPVPRPADPRPGGRGRRPGPVRRRPGPRPRVRPERHRAGRQLRRDLRPDHRPGHAPRPRAGPERPVDRGRPAVRPAVPLIAPARPR